MSKASEQRKSRRNSSRGSSSGSSVATQEPQAVVEDKPVGGPVEVHDTEESEQVHEAMVEDTSGETLPFEMICSFCKQGKHRMTELTDPFCSVVNCKCDCSRLRQEAG